MPLLFLKMSECSMAEALEVTSMLCREDSRVKMLATPESAAGLKKEIVVDSGINSPESFAKLSPDLSWLKMSGDSCQLIMGGGSELFYGTWPRWGTMQNGSCYQPPKLELPTDGIGSGLWPTPSASQARSEGMILQMRAKVESGEITREEAERMIGGSQTPARMTIWPTPAARYFRGHGSEAGYHRRRANGHQQSLNEEIMWRTPKATDGTNGGPNARDKSGALHLSAQAAQYPTLRTRHMRGGTGSFEQLKKLEADGVITKKERMAMAGGGQLSPMWVAWLMGWPIEHTALDALATEWFRSKASKPGKKSKTSRKPND